MALGDKLYLENGEVYEGKYVGVVDGLPTFISAETNSPIDFKPEEFIKITNDDGDIILTEEELVLNLRELNKQPQGWRIQPRHIRACLTCLGLAAFVGIPVILVFLFFYWIFFGLAGDTI